MPTDPTFMRREILEIPAAIDRLLCNGETAVREAARAVRDANPHVLLSVARGSSDHACTYLNYASGLLLRRPMASVGPSVASVYGVDIMAQGALAIAVSQSGASPDIVRMTRGLGASGAFTIAITNDPGSKLAGAARATLPIHAGPERSVAATKSFVGSVVTGLWLLAEIADDAELLAAIRDLPVPLEAATRCDWSMAADAIDGGSLFTLGRGPSLGISHEAALKFKETCRIHAESHSSAEVLHGPVALVGPGFPVIAFAARDAAEASLAETADALADKGARVFVVSDRVTRAVSLPQVRTRHRLTDPIAAIVSFYAMVEAAAVERGIDPDTPRHLGKVTETV